MPRKKGERKKAPELTQEEIEALLMRIGSLIKEKRRAQSSLEDFAYEINISRSALARYEAGGDMMLSSFLKVVYGLNTTPQIFFGDVES